MASFVRRWLHRFIPSHFHDPVGLTRRLLATRDPAALFAMRSAFLGVAAAPLDLLLQVVERRHYRAAAAPRLPMVFVCGPARSGTTLVAQVLIEQLGFAYLNNLTAVFPRAPITANRIFRPERGHSDAPYRSYYGKTVGLAGPNDGLHLWDRWLGHDRTMVPAHLSAADREAMRRFFGAMEQFYRRPVLAKNNSLNACASLVAEVFEQAVFLCLTRDPVYLAQSQLQARVNIHGRDDVPYGLADPGQRGAAGTDVVEDVCRQVLYHQDLARDQQQRLGPERFRLVSYEAFCADPSALVEEVEATVLGRAPREGAPRLPAFTPSTRVQIPPERFQQLTATLARLSGRPG
jgi:hypothetical protein